MRNFVIRLVINALALSAAAWLVDGVALSDDVVQVLLVALVFGLVNALVKPIVTFFSLPFIFLTLGLFVFVINAAMLGLTAALMSGLAVDGIVAALLGSVVISIVSMVLNAVLDDDKKKKKG